jgi:DNA-directed RNA polymerase specialized sigma24 family protein
MYSETSIITLLKKKDAKAFAFLYDKYAPALYGCITKLVPDKRLAANLLEESFKKICSDIHLYDGAKSRLLSWMLCITLKQCLAGKAYSTDDLLYKLMPQSTPSLLQEAV